MFSIGEFASIGSVSVRTLRHYDEIGLLTPASIDPDTGYRSYTAGQLRQLNRIVALKELGLSLAQAKLLTGGITVDELRGMLMLRRAQLEQELQAHLGQLLGVEARLRYIEKEGVMPADDIVARKIPAMGVVAITSRSPSFENPEIVEAVNRCAVQLDQIDFSQIAKVTGPYVLFYDREPDDSVLVHVGQPVAEQPAELPSPAQYLVLPEIEAAVAVRNGAAASIFPAVFQDLARWLAERGYEGDGLARNVWVNIVDDISQVDQQVFEIQLPFTRPD